MIFSENTDGIVMMRTVNADQYTGGVVRWELATDDCSEHMKPTGQTWDKTLAGKLSFTVSVAGGTYDILSLVTTNGMQSWLWVEIDRQINRVGVEMQGRFLYSSNDLAWQSGDNNTITLSAGTHTIDIYSISANLYLDAIALVPAGNALLSHGDTSDNYPDSQTSGADPIVSTESFIDWMRDRTRDDYRVMIVELGHSSDTVRLSTIPYNNEYHQIYYDWILNNPYFEIGLESDNVGVIEALCPDLSINWNNFEFRGYRCKMYIGDKEWAQSSFKHVLSATIESCRMTSDRVYSFEIASDATKYDKTFYKGVEGEVTGSIADVTNTHTAQEAIAWVMAQDDSSGSYQFLNVPSERMNWSVSYTVTESSNMNTVLRKIIASIGAKMRMTQTGFMEIVIPDTGSEAGVNIPQESIVMGGATVAEAIDAVKTVHVNYGDDLSVSTDTGANTGLLTESVDIDTYLVDASNAQTLCDEAAELYQSTRRRWTIDVDGIGSVIQPADFATITDEQITGSGVVDVVHFNPSSNITQIEVTI